VEETFTAVTRGHPLKLQYKDAWLHDFSMAKHL